MFFKKKVTMSLIKEIFESACTLERYQEMARSPDTHQVVRLLQMVRDSQQLCLKSKNKDTAIYRNEFMNEQYLKLSKVLFGKELLYIEGIVNNTNIAFSTVVYLNVSQGLYQKSLKMKSVKGKLKYLNTAISTLEDGLEDSKSDKVIIKNTLRDLTEQKTGLKKVA